MIGLVTNAVTNEEIYKGIHSHLDKIGLPRNADKTLTITTDPESPSVRFKSINGVQCVSWVFLPDSSIRIQVDPDSRGMEYFMHSLIEDLGGGYVIQKNQMFEED